MTDITVIGLGNMGAAIARALLASGRAVTVWNRDPAKAAPLADEGAIHAPSLDAAITASPASIVCIRTHATTTALLAPLGDRLAGRTIIDLSSGGIAEAEELVALLTKNGAEWLIGMINAYPSGIGRPATSILCAGPRAAWAAHADAIRVLGGASTHVGTAAADVPTLFAALFTARMGFMFGLLHGGAVARRAGLDLGTLAGLVPATLDQSANYARLFARTVPQGDYDNAEATMDVYRLALDDVLATFEKTGTPDGFPRLMRDLTAEAVADGDADKQLTFLVERLAKG